MITWILGRVFAYVCLFCLKITRPKLKEVDLEKYRRPHDWSVPGTETEEDTSIRPFTIQVPDDVITDLKERLSRRRGQDSIVHDFEYGFNSRQLQQVVEYWVNVYDWRKEEQFLNSFPHFKTRIEGLDIHFVHIRPDDVSDGKVLLPILLVHGWPGSFFEFYKSIPSLRTGTAGHAFELVIPSIPGYGFSEAPHKPGLSASHCGRIFVQLMQRLGHERFLFQGGDWGAVIGRAMSVVYPDRIIAYHTNMPISDLSIRSIVRMVAASLAPDLMLEEPETEAKMMLPLKDWLLRQLRETGYMHIQATKPDTIGVALNNDPAGLAAYIMEKFSTWTNESWRKRPDGGLPLVFTMDELLTNVMIYWINGNITCSIRFYKEQFADRDASSGQLIGVKTGIVMAEKELFARPVSLLRDHMVNIVRISRVPSAGHFFAFQQPQVFAQELKDFVNEVL